MDKDDFSAQRPKKPMKASIIEAVDNLYPSPQNRAYSVWAKIQASPSLRNLSEWDMLCFCVEYIAMQSQQFLFIEDEAKHLVNLLYTAHYFDRTTDDNKSTRGTNIGDRDFIGASAIGNKSGVVDSKPKSEGKSEIIGDLIIEKGSDAG